jgi:hypothetical protein
MLRARWDVQVLHVVTGDVAAAGTEAAVTIQLVGSDGVSLPVVLTPHNWLPPPDHSARHTPMFSRNQSDAFRVTADRGIGAVVAVRVACDAAQVGSPLTTASYTRMMQGASYTRMLHHALHRHIDGGVHDAADSSTTHAGSL